MCPITGHKDYMLQSQWVQFQFIYLFLIQGPISIETRSAGIVICMTQISFLSYKECISQFQLVQFQLELDQLELECALNGTQIIHVSISMSLVSVGIRPFKIGICPITEQNEYMF